MTRPYRVTWEIDIEAETPEAAARQALAHVSNPDGIAHVFEVIESFGRMHPKTHSIDLDEIDGKDTD